MGCGASSAATDEEPPGAGFKACEVPDALELHTCDAMAAPFELPQSPECALECSASREVRIRVGDMVVVVAGRYRGLKGVIAHERLNRAATRRFYTVAGLYSVKLSLFWFDEHQLRVARVDAKRGIEDVSTTTTIADGRSIVTEL